jgi:hypothetical protein
MTRSLSLRYPHGTTAGLTDLRLLSGFSLPPAAGRRFNYRKKSTKLLREFPLLLDDGSGLIGYSNPNDDLP